MKSRKKPPAHLRTFHALMVEHWSDALAEMMQRGDVTHSFNVKNDKAAYTLLILWTNLIGGKQ